MKTLIPIVVDLLSKHTCVIVPGFGGFIANEKSAVVSVDGDRFFPPCKELIFNQHLSHNDGLLVHALMQQQGISFDEANVIIAGKVKAVKHALQIQKSYSLGDFGFFSSEAAGTVFHAKEMNIEDVYSFGLREFYFPTLQAEEADSKPRARQVKMTSSLSRSIMGGIAATFALFLFCQPIKNNGDYQASLLPAGTFTETVIHNVERLEKERALQEAAKTVNFHLVIDEFETEESAVAFINSFELQDGDTLRILPVNEKHLITFTSSSEFEKTSDRMTDFQSRYAMFSDAFILGIK